jgi:ComF family protein
LSGGISVVCGQCLNNPPAWQDIHAYGLYQGHLRNAILRFKFGGEFYLASLLGGCLHTMTNALPFPDALTPIPRHPQQLRRRGFNQAHEIAKILHRHTGIPLMADLLRRTNIHKPQTGLSAAERRRNVRHFFEAAPQVKGLKLWLVDDVMTTGVTLRAAVQALNAGGALETRVIVVARTPRDATKSWGDATLQELKRFDNGAG